MTQNGSIKLVVFDLDGTLVNAYPAIVESFNFTMKKLDAPNQKSRIIHRAVGWGDKNLLKPFVGPKKLSRALVIYRRHHTGALARKTQFLPGAKALLTWLKKRKYKLAVASNRPTKFSYIILEHLGIKRYFDYVLCGDKLKNPKPHPDILLKILRKLKVMPAQAMYVGDMTVDVLAGNRAQVKTVAIVTGSSTKKEIAALNPTKIIRHLSDVSDILKKSNGYGRKRT